jgi:predicted Zn-dependent protease
MGELETATRHLDTLSSLDEDEMSYRKALLRVRVGDIIGGREYASRIQDDTRKQSFEALLKICDGDYPAALSTWQALSTEYPTDELFAQNTAVSLLYTGQILSARTLLEDLAHRLPTFPILLLNLCTVYELCTERSIDRKTHLVHQTAAKEPAPDSGGWERANFEFKL